MIKSIRIQNYKALRDVTLRLTPIHVLIGPNDSGKSSILEAAEALCRSVDHDLDDAFTGKWAGRELVWRRGSDPVMFDVEATTSEGSFDYSLTCSFAAEGRTVHSTQEQFLSPQHLEPALNGGGNRRRTTVYGSSRSPLNKESPNETRVSHLVHDVLSGVQYYRWNSEFLSLPVAPDSARRFQMEPSGFGLALCLDDILGFDRDRFSALESRFRHIFPDIKSIKLIAESAYRAPIDHRNVVPVLNQADGKGIYFEFISTGQIISAAHVSDGVLLILAYLAVLYLPKPPRLLLVEEPENGIHPRRLQDVLKILRDVVSEQNHTQVILTTHSPYVVDLFSPEEVSLCRKNPEGDVEVHRLATSEMIRAQLDVFGLGEIWTAEGDEALAASTHPQSRDRQP